MIYSQLFNVKATGHGSIQLKQMADPLKRDGPMCRKSAPAPAPSSVPSAPRAGESSSSRESGAAFTCCTASTLRQSSGSRLSTLTCKSYTCAYIPLASKGWFGTKRGKDCHRLYRQKSLGLCQQVISRIEADIGACDIATGSLLYSPSWTIQQEDVT